MHASPCFIYIISDMVPPQIRRAVKTDLIDLWYVSLFSVVMTPIYGACMNAYAVCLFYCINIHNLDLAEVTECWRYNEFQKI